MRKRTAIIVGAIISILLLAILFNGVFRHFVHSALKNRKIPPQYVAAVAVTAQSWEPSLESIGTLAAINGVTVTTQIAGMVTHINFSSGKNVIAGEFLVQLDDATEQEDLKNNQAQLVLSQLNFNRNQKLYQNHAVSKSDYDNALAQLQQAQAQVDKIRVAIEQKHITAPFSGTLGIRQVNIGQYLTPGSPIVTLEAMNPLYVNFSLPQRYLKDIHLGQKVGLRVDAYAKPVFYGTVTALDSVVANDTRNLNIQATVLNQNGLLYPGLFVNVQLFLPTQEKILTLPQTAIDYSLYGNVVFVITDHIVKQRTVKIGSMVGDRVQILEGVEVGEQVVNGGQLKLTDGMEVVTDNRVSMALPPPAALEGGE